MRFAISAKVQKNPFWRKEQAVFISSRNLTPFSPSSSLQRSPSRALCHNYHYKTDTATLQTYSLPLLDFQICLPSFCLYAFIFSKSLSLSLLSLFLSYLLCSFQTYSHILFNFYTCLGTFGFILLLFHDPYHFHFLNSHFHFH